MGAPLRALPSLQLPRRDHWLLPGIFIHVRKKDYGAEGALQSPPGSEDPSALERVCGVLLSPPARCEAAGRPSRWQEGYGRRLRGGICVDICSRWKWKVT